MASCVMPQVDSKVVQSVAERSSKILGEFAQKQAQSLSSATRDEMAIAKAHVSVDERFFRRAHWLQRDTRLRADAHPVVARELAERVRHPWEVVREHDDVLEGGPDPFGVVTHAVDVERLGRIREGFAGVAFTPEEENLLSSVDIPLVKEWPIRLWCAKEAVAKALASK